MYGRGGGGGWKGFSPIVKRSWFFLLSCKMSTEIKRVKSVHVQDFIYY